MAKKLGSLGSPRTLNGKIVIGGSASNGETTKIESSVDIEERLAMRIYSIEYFGGYLTSALVDASLYTALAATLDETSFGFAFLATMPANGFKEDSPGVIDWHSVTRKDMGTAATGMVLVDPFITVDCTKRYPGGMLVHPANLYHWYATLVTMGAGCTIPYKVYYSMEAISDDLWDVFWKQIFTTQAG